MERTASIAATAIAATATAAPAITATATATTTPPPSLSSPTSPSPVTHSPLHPLSPLLLPARSSDDKLRLNDIHDAFSDALFIDAANAVSLYGAEDLISIVELSHNRKLYAKAYVVQGFALIAGTISSISTATAGQSASLMSRSSSSSSSSLSLSLPSPIAVKSIIVSPGRSSGNTVGWKQLSRQLKETSSWNLVRTRMMMFFAQSQDNWSDAGYKAGDILVNANNTWLATFAVSLFQAVELVGFSQLMTTLTEITITILLAMSWWWRKCDLPTFTRLLQATTDHNMTCNMVKAGAKFIKVKYREIKTNKDTQNSQLPADLANEVMINFVHQCNSSKGNNLSLTKNSRRLAEHCGMGKDGFSLPAKRGRTPSKSAAAVESAAAVVADTDEAMGVSVKLEVNAASDKAASSEPSPKRSKSDKSSSPVDKDAKSLRDVQIKLDAAQETIKQLQEQIETEAAILNLYKCKDTHAQMERIKLRNAVSSTPAVHPLSSPPGATATLPAAPAVTNAAVLWLDNLTPLAEERQGVLGIVGIATMSIRRTGAEALIVAALPAMPKPHHVIFKKSFVLASDVDSHYNEEQVMEILRTHPHPNIHGVFGLAKTKEVLAHNKDFFQVGQAFAIELIHGVSLFDLLTANSNVDAHAEKQHNYSMMIRAVTLDHPLTVLKMMLQAVNGVTHLHQHGIVHRDIHSSNIMVTGPDLARFGPHKSLLELRDNSLSAFDSHRSVDGFSCYPVIDLQSTKLDEDLVTADEDPKHQGLACRLSFIDMNSALPLRYALQTSSAEEIGVKWDGGASEYSLMTYFPSPEQVAGWKVTLNKFPLEEYWIARDNFSIALVLCDIIRGCPMTVKRDVQPRSKGVDPKMFNKALLASYFKYCHSRLSPIHVSDGVVVPSLCEYLCKEQMNKDHWMDRSFVERNKTLSKTIGQPRFARIKLLLHEMTTLSWMRVDPLAPGTAPGVNDDAVLAAISKQRRPSKLLENLASEIVSTITLVSSYRIDWDQQLASVLAKRNLKIVEMSKHGDCLYLAFIHQLRNYIASSSPPPACSWLDPSSPTHIDFSLGVLVIVKQLRKMVRDRVKAIYDGYNWKKDEEPDMDAVAKLPEIQQLERSAWLVTGRDAKGKGPKGKETGRNAQLTEIATMEKWNSEAGENVMTSLCAMYDVCCIIIPGAEETMDTKDAIVGKEEWSTIYVVRTTGHYSGTLPLL